MKMTSSSPLHLQRGATLIEVMVSALIVAFGVLAMIALQSNAIKFSKTSEYRSIATLLANDLADRMRVNADVAALATSNPYDVTAAYSRPTEVPSRPACKAEDCTPDELAKRDVGEWKRALHFSLPGGNGYVQTNAADRVVDIWVAWQDPGEAEAAAPGSKGECPENFVKGVKELPRCMFFRIALPPPLTSTP